MKEKRNEVPKKEKKELIKNQDPHKKEVKGTKIDDFDFGGLPKSVPFKRNIGCGG